MARLKAELTGFEALLVKTIYGFPELVDVGGGRESVWQAGESRR